MSNPLKLTEGKRYRVVKAFNDYDGIVHPVGEEWFFVGTNFSPYEDGLTLHVIKAGGQRENVFRFKWTEEEQAELIQNFRDFVAEVAS